MRIQLLAVVAAASLASGCGGDVVTPTTSTATAPDETGSSGSGTTTGGTNTGGTSSGGTSTGSTGGTSSGSSGSGTTTGGGSVASLPNPCISGLNSASATVALPGSSVTGASTAQAGTQANLGVPTLTVSKGLSTMTDQCA